MDKHKINKLLLSDTEDDVRIGFELAMKYYPGTSYRSDNHEIVAFVEDGKIIIGTNGIYSGGSWVYTYHNSIVNKSEL